MNEHITTPATASIPWPHCQNCRSIEPMTGWKSQCRGAASLRAMEPSVTDVEMVQAFVIRKWGFRLEDAEASEVVSIIQKARRTRLDGV